MIRIVACTFHVFMMALACTPASGQRLDVVTPTAVDRALPASGDIGSSPQPVAEKPRVGILIYDGVQIIDHAAPWEVLGQYNLNEVFTVARDSGPVTTFMGMRVLPSYSFDNHPPLDVLVIPGGDVRGVRGDTALLGWIRRQAVMARHVLGICSGVTLLAEGDLLDGRRVTTFYDLLDDLAERPEVTVVEDQLVVEDGKYVTTTGTGIEGALRISELLNGGPWTRVVALNMEFQPLPEEQRTPRAWLADMNLPSSPYRMIPWREAQLTEYDGDLDSWTMAWRFSRAAATAPDQLSAALSNGLREEGWRQVRANGEGTSGQWTSKWLLEGRDGEEWMGSTTLRSVGADELEFAVEVERTSR